MGGRSSSNGIQLRPITTALGTEEEEHSSSKFEEKHRDLHLVPVVCVLKYPRKFPFRVNYIEVMGSGVQQHFDNI